MKVDILGKLFSSNALVRVMRLFMLNSKTGFELRDIASRCKITISSVRVETNLLKSINFIKKKNFIKLEEKTSKIKSKKKQVSQIIKRKISGWFLNQDFPYLNALKILLIDRDLAFNKEQMIKRFKPLGKIKLLIVSGVFIQENNSRVDLLIVGDKLNKQKINSVISSIEADVGKELSYTVFSSSDFLYRFNMRDKFICDILESPHEKVVDLGGFYQSIKSK